MIKAFFLILIFENFCRMILNRQIIGFSESRVSKGGESDEQESFSYNPQQEFLSLFFLLIFFFTLGIIRVILIIGLLRPFWRFIQCASSSQKLDCCIFFWTFFLLFCHMITEL